MANQFDADEVLVAAVKMANPGHVPYATHGDDVALWMGPCARRTGFQTRTLLKQRREMRSGRWRAKRQPGRSVQEVPYMQEVRRRGPVARGLGKGVSPRRPTRSTTIDPVPAVRSSVRCQVESRVEVGRAGAHTMPVGRLSPAASALTTRSTSTWRTIPCRSIVRSGSPIGELTT